ncbi:hypothetical protein BKA80DRAFT_107654 [Phyllosticta citrichinensis]
MYKVERTEPSPSLTAHCHQTYTAINHQHLPTKPQHPDPDNLASVQQANTRPTHTAAIQPPPRNACKQVIRPTARLQRAWSSSLSVEAWRRLVEGGTGRDEVGAGGGRRCAEEDGIRVAGGREGGVEGWREGLGWWIGDREVAVGCRECWMKKFQRSEISRTLDDGR